MDRLEVHQLKRISLDLVAQTPVGEIRQDPDTEEDYKIQKPVKAKEYLWFLEQCVKRGTLKPEEVRDYLIKHKIVPVEFFAYESK